MARPVHIIASITATLGYPKDMWIARNFIDFVHPKDRLTFTNQITRGVTLPFGDNLKVKVSINLVSINLFKIILIFEGKIRV